MECNSDASVITESNYAPSGKSVGKITCLPTLISRCTTKKKKVGTPWREEIPREVVARCDLNGLSGRDDSGAVYHERPVESSSSSSLSLSLGRCDQQRQCVPPTPHSSSSPWIDKPDQIPGDGYHRGQAGCRKPAAQALLRPPHYSGQVDPANCSSAKVASKRTNCVTPGWGWWDGG